MHSYFVVYMKSESEMACRQICQPSLFPLLTTPFLYTHMHTDTQTHTHPVPLLVGLKQKPHSEFLYGFCVILLFGATLGLGSRKHMGFGAIRAQIQIMALSYTNEVALDIILNPAMFHSHHL